MTKKTLTRAELYELVWSQPRAVLAKELGVSDVMIGKYCVRADVPAPPRGYWARLSAGKATTRLLLPIRMPGQSDEIELGAQDAHRRYWSQAEDPNEPLVPPVFVEDIDSQVRTAMHKVGRVVASSDLGSPHPGLRRLMAKEAARREKYQSDGYSSSYYKPYFDASHHQRQLRIFNSICVALGRVFEGHEVYCRDEWEQGIGTSHLLRLRLSMGSTGMELEILEPGEPKRAKRHKAAVSTTTLRVGWEGGLLPVQEWADRPDGKLELQLEDIVRALLRRAELSLRAHAQSAFERRVERRKEILEEMEKTRQEEERKRLEAIAAHTRKMRQEILDLAHERRAAHDIREMVAALAHHPDLATVDRTMFDQWQNEAMRVADMLDPMSRPLAEMLKTFVAVASVMQQGAIPSAPSR